MFTVFVEMNGKLHRLELKGKSIRTDALLETLGVYPETAVVLKDGRLVCDDERLTDGDRVKVVVATSRG
jgi:sulfur carrier protein